MAFEHGMFTLTQDAEQIVSTLREARIEFEIIGGLAVNTHIFQLDPSRMFVTRDVDLLVRRSDLEEIVRVAEAHGYTARKIVGGFMLIRPNQKVAEAVHMIFAGEHSKSTQIFPHPALHPQESELFGVRIPVAPMRDLLLMKLNANRIKDLTHLQVLDESGLITPELVAGLPPVLRQRLEAAREQFALEAPDVE